MRIPRAVALWTIATLIAASSVVSFAESYRGLYLWAHGHGLVGLWSAAWPLMVDVFIAVGELSLFVAMVERWESNSRYAAWAVVGVGLVLSVAGNVGHVSSDLFSYRATAAVPPVAAAASLAVGLGVLKRIRNGTEVNGIKKAADALVQRAREDYAEGLYFAAIEHLNKAEELWPGMRPEVKKARKACILAAQQPALETAE